MLISLILRQMQNFSQIEKSKNIFFKKSIRIGLIIKSLEGFLSLKELISIDIKILTTLYSYED